MPDLQASLRELGLGTRLGLPTSHRTSCMHACIKARYVSWSLLRFYNCIHEPVLYDLWAFWWAGEVFLPHHGQLTYQVLHGKVGGWETITKPAKWLIGARKSSYALTITKIKLELATIPKPAPILLNCSCSVFLTSISLSSCLLDASSCSTAFISCSVNDCLGESASSDRTLDLSEGLVLSALGSVNPVCRLVSSSLLMLFAPPKAIFTKDCPGERCITSTAIAQSISGYDTPSKAHVCCNRGIYKSSWCSKETDWCCFGRYTLKLLLTVILKGLLPAPAPRPLSADTAHSFGPLTYNNVKDQRAIVWSRDTTRGLDRELKKMGECKESSVSVQSTLRGPMILAKVITDALENKKRVRELEHKYAIAIKHAWYDAY